MLLACVVFCPFAPGRARDPHDINMDDDEDEDEDKSGASCLDTLPQSRRGGLDPYGSNSRTPGSLKFAAPVVVARRLTGHDETPPGQP